MGQGSQTPLKENDCRGECAKLYRRSQREGSELGVTEDQLKHAILAGVPGAIRKEILMANPANLEDLTKAAIRAEAACGDNDEDPASKLTAAVAMITDRLEEIAVTQARMARPPVDRNRRETREQRYTRSETCRCCGKRGHGKRDCRLQHLQCRICGKEGHLARVCFHATKAQYDQQQPYQQQPYQQQPYQQQPYQAQPTSYQQQPQQ